MSNEGTIAQLASDSAINNTAGDLLEIVTQPICEPISLVDMKMHLRVTSDDEDDYISALIAGARNLVQREQGRQLITATYRYYLPCFPAWVVGLGPAPLQSILSITYYDDNNELQTLDSSLYQIVRRSHSPGVMPLYSTMWPSTYERPDAVRIVFSCGYGGVSDVPDTTIHAVRLLVAHWYASREAAAQSSQEIPYGVSVLINLERASW